MLLATQTVTTNCSLPPESFKIEASPVAFEILSQKLYSDNILAIIRELISNAYESHVAANQTQPIDIQIPTTLTPTFKIRDYGTGLSLDQFRNLYTVFFKSTKRTSNEFTGCFGLGSKAPYAYSDVFMINSYYNGVKYSAICSKSTGSPDFRILKNEPTEEPNGLEITIGVNKEDVRKFTSSYIRYIKFMHEINTTAYNIDIINNHSKFEVPDKVFYSPVSLNCIENIGIFRHSAQEDLPNIIIKQGQNVYRLDKISEPIVTVIELNTITQKYFRYLQLVFEVPIGTFNITPSRESLIADTKLKQGLNAIISDIEKNHEIIVKKLIQSTTEILSNNYTDYRVVSSVLDMATQVYSNITKCYINNSALRLVWLNTYESDYAFFIDFISKKNNCKILCRTYNNQCKIRDGIATNNNKKTLFVYDNRIVSSIGI